jgi:hypothetical protein
LTATPAVLPAGAAFCGSRIFGDGPTTSQSATDETVFRHRTAHSAAAAAIIAQFMPRLQALQPGDRPAIVIPRASGFASSSLVALKPAISGSILALPAVSFVISTALPLCSAFAFPTHQAIIGEPECASIPCFSFRSMLHTAEESRKPWRHRDDLRMLQPDPRQRIDQDADALRVDPDRVLLREAGQWPSPGEYLDDVRRRSASISASDADHAAVDLDRGSSGRRPPRNRAAAPRSPAAASARRARPGVEPVEPAARAALPPGDAQAEQIVQAAAIYARDRHL